MKRIHPATAAAFVIGVLVTVGLLRRVGQAGFDAPVSSWLWWILFLITPTFAAVWSVMLVTAPVYPPLSALRAMGPLLVAWLIVESVVLLALPESAGAQLAAGFGMAAALASLLLAGFPAFYLRTRDARRRFAELERCGQASRPQVNWHGRLLDEGVGLVRVPSNKGIERTARR